VLKRDIGIFISKERVRHFIPEWEKTHSGRILESFTLGDFIARETSAIRGNEKRNPEMSALAVIRDAVKDTRLDYFSYWKEDLTLWYSSFDNLKNFFHLMKINSGKKAILPEELSFTYPEILHHYPSAKKNDIQRLFGVYQEKLTQAGVLDRGDRINTAAFSPRPDLLAVYDDIYLDSMELEMAGEKSGGIHFYNSAAEKQIYQYLRQKNTQYLSWDSQENSSLREPVQFLEYTAGMSQYRAAASLARWLITEKKADPSRILVVSHSLHDPARLEAAFMSYNIPLFFSRGKAVGQIHVFSEITAIVRKISAGQSTYKESTPHLRKLYAKHARNYHENKDNIFVALASLENMLCVDAAISFFRDLEKDGTRLPAEWILQSLARQSITVKNNGILTQEANQTLGTRPPFVIMLDAENIFPGASDNIFYSSGDRQKYFYSNDPVLLSRFYLQNIIQNTENLFILLPGNPEKASFIQSIVQDAHPNGSQIWGTIRTDLQSLLKGVYSSGKFYTEKDALTQKPDIRFTLEESRENFLAYIHSREKSPTDGQLPPKEEKVESLSPSRFSRFRNCPHQYFYQYLLDIAKPLPEAEIQPMDKGSILHKIFEVFSRYMRFRHRRGLQNFSDADGFAILNKIIENVLFREWKNKNAPAKTTPGKNLPPEYRQLWYSIRKNLEDGENDLKKITGIVRRFFEREKEAGLFAHLWKNEAWLSEFFQVDNNRVNFILPVGGRDLAIHGRVDRVDIRETNDSVEMDILDYKPISKMDMGNLKEKWEQNKDYQLIFYLEALAIALRQNPAKFPFPAEKNIRIRAYLLSFHKGNSAGFSGDPFAFNKVEWDAEKKRYIAEIGQSRGKLVSLEKPRTEVDSILTGVLDSMESGDYFYAANEKACENCDYSGFCLRALRKEMAPDLFTQEEPEDEDA